MLLCYLYFDLSSQHYIPHNTGLISCLMVKDTCADNQHGYWLSLHLKSGAKATPIRYNKILQAKHLMALLICKCCFEIETG
jgi:hypothetical protein